MIRCVECGCSRLDSQGVGCALCGGAPAVGWEQCYIDEATKAKLLAHAAELKGLGLTVEEPGEPLQKDAGLVVGAVGLVIQVVETIRPGTFRELVLKLRDFAILKDQILRLRLDEPETISEILEGGGTEDANLDPAPKKSVVERKHAKGLKQKRHKT